MRIPGYVKTAQAARLAAYVLLAVAGIVGFWNVQLRADRAEERRMEICEASNDLRQVLIEVIQEISTQIPEGVNTEELDPQLFDILEAQVARAEEFQQESIKLLAVREC